MTANGPIRLATRGSELARIQAGTVRDALERRRREAELVTVETTGDRIRDELLHRLGKTGAFVRALDERVLDGDLDAAVHSMKDVPTESPAELVVAAVPERGPATDVLVTPDGSDLEALPRGATVGTSSLRRGAQLQAQRPDLEVEPLRGNVDTRLQKLLAPSLQAERERRREEARPDGREDDHQVEEPTEWVESLSVLEREALDREVDTEYDAIVLAEAGLERMDLLGQVEATRLSRETFVPAPGQGALAITARRDSDVVEVLRALDHRPTRIATTVERIVLAELGGGCVAPLGVHATLQGRYVHVRVAAYSRDGAESVEVSRDLPAERYAAAAREFAAEVADRGAADLIVEAKRDAGAGTGSDGTDDGEAAATDDSAGAAADEEPGATAAESDDGAASVHGEDG